MQIRLYSRQDDKEFRTLMQSLCEGTAKTFDLDGKDNDLRNVEGSYFGNEGVFLIAEDEGVIKGFIGARREPNAHASTTQQEYSNQEMVIKRLWLSPDLKGRAKEIEEQLLAVVKNHAYQLDFQTIKINQFS